MKSGLTSDHTCGHTNTGAQFKVSSEKAEKQAINLAIPGLVV